MTRKRTFGTLAAIGGATAVVALLYGVPSAQADELSDLRTNNELLQKQLDQLAQAAQVGPGQRMYQNMATQREAAAMGGSFPKSFLIPGTDTSLRVGGNITFITDYLLQGGNPNGSPWSTTLGTNGQALAIPINGTTASARSSNLWGESIRQSLLLIETRTPTPYGEARTFLSIDFNGGSSFSPGGPAPAAVSDNVTPRAKWIYGTLGGWLVGQANSNFSDPDANSESIDFGGNVGEPGRVRVAQVRYTMPLAWAWGGALSFSAENPDVEVQYPNGFCGSDAGGGSACFSPGGAVGGVPVAAVQPNVAKPTAPDLTMALYIPQPWGHVDIGGVLRPGLTISDGAMLSRNFVGGGGAFSFDVKPGWFTPKDDILFHFVAGTGLGAYLNASTNAAIETNYAGTSSVAGTCPVAGPAISGPGGCIRAKLVPSFGGEIGYQHWWAPNLRSTFSYGIQVEDELDASMLQVAHVGGTAGSTNRQIETAHANLLWNPVPFVTIGAEYLWAQRTVLVPAAAGLGKTGQMQALIGKFDVAF